jgi:hypothetical protein
MLCREIIAVCSQIHTKHINTLCGQNVELLIAVNAVTIGLLFFVLPVALLPNVVHDLLIIAVSKSHTATNHILDLGPRRG